MLAPAGALRHTYYSDFAGQREASNGEDFAYFHENESDKEKLHFSGEELVCKAFTEPLEALPSPNCCFLDL